MLQPRARLARCQSVDRMIISALGPVELHAAVVGWSPDGHDGKARGDGRYAHRELHLAARSDQPREARVLHYLSG